jgi:hypothetical protein
MHSNGRLAIPITAAFLLVLPCCGTKDIPGPTGDASSSSDATRPMPPANCDAGQHADSEGHCVADADAALSPAEPTASGSAAAPPGKCPQLAAPERVYAFDWANEFGVDAALASKLKGVSGAAAESMALSQDVENELRQACVGIATTLGLKGPFGGASATCQAAVDAVRATREKLGPTTKVTVNVHQPVCPMPVLAECASTCAGAQARASCEGNAAPLGTCVDNCDGICEYTAAGKCDGNCQGRCDSGFSGTCSGTCMGKCNGREVSGACAGKCEGTCDGNGRGVCKGVCRGACQGTVRACPGLCMGKCSSPVRDPKCPGMVKVDGGGLECSAYCATRSVRKVACSAAVVNVTIAGAPDAAGARVYQQAIERNLPPILKVQRRLQGRLDLIAKDQAIVSSGLAAITASSASALPALSPCLFGVEKGVTEGIDRLNSDFRGASLIATVAQAR